MGHTRVTPQCASVFTISSASFFGAAKATLPWLAAEVEETVALMGEDYWPYGIEPNRTTIEAFLQYAYEQGVCHRLLTPEELYPREVQTAFKI